MAAEPSNARRRTAGTAPGEGAPPSSPGEGAAPTSPGAGAAPTSPAAVLARAWRSVVWYLEGMMGADAYKRYLEHQARTHPGHKPMTERQFWKDKMDWEDRNPQGRCC